MGLVSQPARTVLRRQLRALALVGSVLTSTEVEARIDHLLAEVLEEAGPIVAPHPLRLDEENEDQRIVVTGMGVVSPFGVGLDRFWTGLSEGRSAVGRITHFDPSPFPAQLAAEVPDFEPRDFMDGKEARRMSRSSQFAVAAARAAVAMAGLRIDEGNADEIGTLIGCGTIAMPDVEQAMTTLLLKNPLKISPFFIPSALPNMPASQVSIQLGLRGHSSAISTACAAGAQAIGEAAAIIRRGDAEVMLAGGAEAPISALSLGSFCAIRALSTRNHEPQRASRPFDVDRDGFVPGEGAGVLVLERLSVARRRGATVLAELIGYASSSDAHHVTAPEPDGLGAARAIKKALHNARIDPQQVDYINAHATSTPVGDIAETHAIKLALGEYASSVPISASKSMIGHLTGAAGAVEAIATILALRHGIIPPTINLDQPDPACDLDYVPHQARPAALEIALSNSFGFGGMNAVLVFRRL